MIGKRDRQNLQKILARVQNIEGSRDAAVAAQMLSGVIARVEAAVERDEARKAAEAAKTAGKQGSRNGMARS